MYASWRPKISKKSSLLSNPLTSPWFIFVQHLTSGGSSDDAELPRYGRTNKLSSPSTFFSKRKSGKCLRSTNLRTKALHCEDDLRSKGESLARVFIAHSWPMPYSLLDAHSFVFLLARSLYNLVAQPSKERAPSEGVLTAVYDGQPPNTTQSHPRTRKTIPGEHMRAHARNARLARGHHESRLLVKWRLPTAERPEASSGQAPCLCA